MSYEIVISLQQLPPELLLIIFKYLSQRDLMNLMQLCTNFHKIIRNNWNVILFGHRHQFLVTNQSNKHFRKRSLRNLEPFHKHRISNNWKEGRFAQANIYASERFIPWFHLEKNSIWWRTDDSIRCFRRSMNNIDCDHPQHVLHGINPKEECKFVVKNNVISTACGNMIQLYRLDDHYTTRLFIKYLYLTSIDMDSNMLAVGSKEGKVQMFLVNNGVDLLTHNTLQYEDRVWCLALNHNRLAVGTAANNSSTCVGIVDTQSGETVQEILRESRGAGILHLKWEDPDTLWSGSYDYYLRRWDLRSGECVQKFLDPLGSKVNCFDFDFVNTVVTGCDDYRATLWDMRQTKYVQMYFMDPPLTRWNRSPVYSIAFDAEHLFTATDRCVNMLNFSLSRGPCQDYSGLFSRQLVVC